jgi:Uma2 family endonuclease
MSSQPKHLLTPEEYLAIEREAQFRHEYYRGEMFEMSGGTRNHNVISRNIDLQFGRQRPQCEVYRSDMRVLVDAEELYTYLDVVVVCEKPQFLDKGRDTLLNPLALAEILSPSTESYDRSTKLEYYQTIKSLQQYLLVTQTRMHAELYTRTEAGWLYTSANGPDAAIDFAGCRLNLSDVYQNVDLAAQS